MSSLFNESHQIRRSDQDERTKVLRLISRIRYYPSLVTLG